MTTKQAVHVLLNSEDWLLTWLRAGRTKEERRNLRHRHERGQLSLEKQHELLRAFGFGVVQEMQWTKPT
jgi:hypothetical protein